MSHIPYGRQHISQADIDAVVAVLQSDFLTQGPQVPRFEQAVARYCGAAHAVAVNSATSALHTACLALGLRAGGLAWTVSVTFTASANAARYCGAEVDFVDIDPRTLNLCPEALAAKLRTAAERNRLPDVLIPAHLCGEPCDMAAISSLCRQYGVRIIEDASHAIGARYRDGSPVGNCRYSDITVFSFHPVKIITTAEGGIATTNCPEWAEQMALLRSHGITRDPERMESPAHGGWYYQQITLGFNYRMTELQAALGCSQMQRLDEFVARRHRLAERYDRLLADLPLGLPQRHPQAYSALHLYPVRVQPESGCSRLHVYNCLRAGGIGVNVHYIPVHTQPDYRRNFGFSVGDFPHAEQYYAEALSLPLYYDLSEAGQDRVVAALRQALRHTPKAEA